MQLPRYLMIVQNKNLFVCKPLLASNSSHVISCVLVPFPNNEFFLLFKLKTKKTSKKVFLVAN